jgi:hypothetical protein
MTETKWTPTSERLPDDRGRAYQVVAICKKVYPEGTNYAGKGVRGVYQDWVLRNWPDNYTHWFELPETPR